MRVPTAAVEAALSQARNIPVRIDRRTPLSGGDISETERLHTNAGTYVLKSSRHPVPGLFQAEREGLAALARSGTSLAIPAVIACEEIPHAFLILDDLGQGARGPDLDERVGHGLAELHRATARAFGFARDTFCGATVQPNPWTSGWLEFYARFRLEHQRHLATRAGLLSAHDAETVDRLIARLNTWLTEPPEGPALIHGDLWAGNLHVTSQGMPALIDPAVSFSHREAEWGMMLLFGGFSPRVLQAYTGAFPLDPGWQERTPLYQLYHLMNHLNLFGRTYHGRVMEIVRRYA